MLFYGDRTCREDPRAVIAEMRDVAAAPPEERWIERHGRLVRLFIRAAELVQGLADADFAAAGEDRLGRTARGAHAGLRLLAARLVRSWRDGAEPPPGELAALLGRLDALPLPPAIDTRTPEGYAFYALYPESYALAAAALPRPLAAVIGLRSIGTGLGAMAAAQTGAALFWSVRPAGHPFRRELLLGKDVREALRACRHGDFAIADEGPGLSGSSFAAAAQALESLGAARERIHFLPSHEGQPGHAASPAIRERWAAAPRRVAPFETLVLQSGEARHRLATWVEDLTGPAVAPLEDIGGGAWRALCRHPVRPPADPRMERRKFLLRSRAGTFVLRFAGLGRQGEATARRARILAQAGFSPPVLGLRHGFLVERWLGHAAPIDLAVDRGGLVEHLAAYLAFRARALPAAAGSGATLMELGNVLRHNLAEASGREADLSSHFEEARALEPLVRRVETDNRLHAWEWLREGGRLVKTDACDHCAAHDLVGCQDIAWDVVGAKVELALDEEEYGRLCRCLAVQDITCHPRLLSFLESCYLAYQLGSFYLAAKENTNPEDRSLLDKQRSFYQSRLTRRLDF